MPLLRLILLILAFGLSITALYSQSVVDTVSIKKQVLAINAMDGRRIDTIDMELIPAIAQGYDGGWEVMVYYKGNEVVKIVDKVGLSYGVITTSYYLSNNKVFYTQLREENFPYDEDHAFNYYPLVFKYSCEIFMEGDEEFAVTNGEPLIPQIGCNWADFAPSLEILWLAISLSK